MKKSQQSAGSRSDISLSPDRRTLSVRIPISFRRHRAGKQVITPSNVSFSSPARLDSALMQAVIRGHHWRELLERGEYTSAAELAKARGINDSYLSRVLRLTLLAPDIVESILNGTQPKSLELQDLLIPFPAHWEAQRKLLASAERRIPKCIRSG